MKGKRAHEARGKRQGGGGGDSEEEVQPRIGNSEVRTLIYAPTFPIDMQQAHEPPGWFFLEPSGLRRPLSII
jgi:hypothetical protein